MAKSYTEQLAEWVRQRKKSANYEKNLAAFLSVKDDVTGALAQGWPVKTIWAHLVEQKRIGIGYDMFLLYVKRYVRQAEDQVANSRSKKNVPLPEAESSGNPARQSRPTASDATVPNGPEKLPGFTFNAAPNREELI